MMQANNLEPAKPNSIPNDEANDLLTLAINTIINSLLNDEAKIPEYLKNHRNFVILFNHIRSTKKVLNSLPSLGLALEKNLTKDEMAIKITDVNDLSQVCTQLTSQLNFWREKYVSQYDTLLSLNLKLQEEIVRKNSIESALRASEYTYRQLAVRDSLTGIYNRGYFIEMASQEAEAIKQYGGLFCILMLDVDHFKNFNDTHGHLAGDEALKTLTKAVGEHLRKTDFFARYGGEEFILLLGNTSLEAGILIAERIRQEVMKTPIEISKDLTVTIEVSIGVACLDGLKVRKDDLVSDEALHKAVLEADTALYAAKENGRNLVWWEGRHSSQGF